MTRAAFALDQPTRAGQRLEAAPDVAGQLDTERQLRLLLLDRNFVAVDSRREAALRADAKLVERDVLGRRVEAALEVVLLLERAELRRDEPEHHPHVLGRVPQRREVARARVVELEEEPVVGHLVEDGVGYARVAALGAPARAEVTAAQVGADG